MPVSTLLAQGFLIGFGVAAPVGVLCIKTTLARGWPAGVAVGVGAALADTLYGGVAVFGLTFVISFLHSNSEILRAIGGIFLLFLAYRIIRQNAAVEAAPPTLQAGSLLASLTGTFFLTLTNPVTLVCFMAVFAGLGILTDISRPDALLVIFSVFLGSLAWWLCLSLAVRVARSRITEATMRKINILSGSIIAAFGALALLSIKAG